MNKKIKFTDETIEIKNDNCTHVLHRIVATKSIPAHHINEGDFGGYIEDYKNLSEDGDCWIAGDAKVYENANISGDAYVYEDCEIYGNALIYDYAEVFGHAKVYGNASVFGKALVYGTASVYGSANVYDEADVFENAVVCGNANVYGESNVGGDAKIFGDSKISGKAVIRGEHIIDGSSRINANLSYVHPEDLNFYNKWKELKDKNPNKTLLFKRGDNYDAYFVDADAFKNDVNNVHSIPCGKFGKISASILQNIDEFEQCDKDVKDKYAILDDIGAKFYTAKMVMYPGDKVARVEVKEMTNDDINEKINEKNRITEMLKG